MTELALHRPASDGAAARVGQWVIAVLCLMGPAFINGAPLVYPDTRAYYLGGHTAVEKLLSVMHPAPAGAGGDALSETIQKARGVRSAFYSLFTYLPTVSVSLWLVVLFQALIVTALVRLVLRLLLPDISGWGSTLLIALLAVLTTAPWVTSEIMPDVFTPIMALGIIVLLVFWDELNARTIVGVWLAIAGSLVMHTSNLLIALGLLGVSLVVCHRTVLARKAAYLAIVAAFGWAVLGMLAVSIVGFKQATLTPQAPPFLLARSLADGPARLYLQAHCPQAGYAMCGHLDKLDLSPEKFMWDRDGVYSAVSPDEEAKLRAEGNHIFLAAAAEHPWMQGAAMVRNTFAQLTSFGYYEYYVPSSAEYTGGDITLHLPDQAAWQRRLSSLGSLIAVMSAVAIFYSLLLDDLSVLDRQFAALIVATVLLQALIGAVSEPAPRYEARVIWLLALTALALAVRKLSHARAFSR